MTRRTTLSSPSPSRCSITTTRTRASRAIIDQTRTRRPRPQPLLSNLSRAGLTPRTSTARIAGQAQPPSCNSIRRINMPFDRVQHPTRSSSRINRVLRSTRGRRSMHHLGRAVQVATVARKLGRQRPRLITIHSGQFLSRLASCRTSVPHNSLLTSELP